MSSFPISIDVSLVREEQRFSNDFNRLLDQKIHQIVLFFFGKYEGYPKGNTKAYMRLFQKMHLTEKKGLKMVLYDLKAWGRFFSKPDGTPLASSLEEKNLTAISLNDLFTAKNIEVFPSCDFFKFLKTIDDAAFIQYFQNIFKERTVIFLKSQEVLAGKEETKHPMVNELFETDTPPILKPLQDLPAKAVYSAMEWLELVWLTVKRVEITMQEGEAAAPNGEITILYALPNDEYRYVHNDQDQGDGFVEFKQDIREYLKIKKLTDTLKHINIIFYSFKYGSNPSVRPYLNGPFLTSDSSQLLPELKKLAISI